MELISDVGCESTELYEYVMLPPINSGLSDPAPLCDDSAALLSVNDNVDALTWNVGSTPELLVVPSMGRARLPQ